MLGQGAKSLELSYAEGFHVGLADSGLPLQVGGLTDDEIAKLLQAIEYRCVEHSYQNLHVCLTPRAAATLRFELFFVHIL